jgi:Protein of unknown function (DUF3224)
MTRITRRLFYLMPAVFLLLVPAANAATTQTATGSFTVSATTISVHVINGNTIIDQSLTILATGDISGSLIGSDIAVITSTGSGFLVGSGTFTGTILGRSGTVGIGFAGTFSPITAQLNLQGVFLQGTGTGQLARISGTGTILGIFNVGGTYAFTVTFHS